MSLKLQAAMTRLCSRGQASNARVALTHDLSTMVPALQLQGQPAFTTIVVVPDSLPIGRIIEDILLLDQCSRESDWTAVVI
jgi:hypothetical protein